MTLKKRELFFIQASFNHQNDATTLSMTTLRMVTLSIAKPSIMALNAMKLSIMAVSLMAFSLKAHSQHSLKRIAPTIHRRNSRKKVLILSLC
jgi:hypothetical protein